GRALGRRADARLRRVRHHDPAPRRSLDVDIVDPDAGAADHLQPLCALDQLAREPRRRADDDAVVAADDAGEIRVALDVDVEAGAQQLEPRLRDRLANENRGGTPGSPTSPLLASVVGWSGGAGAGGFAVRFDRCL